MSACSDKIRSVTSCWPPEVTEIGSVSKPSCFKAARPLMWAMTKNLCRCWSGDKGRWPDWRWVVSWSRPRATGFCLTISFSRAARDVKSSTDASRPARGAVYGQAQMKDNHSWCSVWWYMQGKYAAGGFRLGQHMHQGHVITTVHYPQWWRKFTVQ